MVGCLTNKSSSPPFGLSPDCLVEAGSGNEGIDEVAVEGIGDTSESFDSDGVSLFAALKIGDGLLADTHADGQICSGHSEGISNGSNPSPVRP